jgi:hypothetical protein
MTTDEASDFLEDVRTDRGLSLRGLCNLIFQKQKHDRNFNIKELELLDIE